jgi:hypothetical protein
MDYCDEYAHAHTHRSSVSLSLSIFIYIYMYTLLPCCSLDDMSSLTLFEAKDFDTMFHMMDATESGSINQKQVLNALDNLGILSDSVRHRVTGKDTAAVCVRDAEYVSGFMHHVLYEC